MARPAGTRPEHGNINLIELPYESNSQGTSDLVLFNTSPVSRVYANSTTPSQTVSMASIRAVDSTGHVILEALHAEMEQYDESHMDFNIHPFKLAYLYLGAGPEDTLDINGHDAFVTYADFRMGIATILLESTDSVFGMFPVFDLEVQTNGYTFTVLDGLVAATGTHWILKTGTIEGLEGDGFPIMQVTAFRPRTAGVAERIITDSEFPEIGFFDNSADQSGWSEQFMIPGPVTPCPSCQKGKSSYTFVAGKKIYELSNHLGNVLSTISDRKLQVNETDGKVDFYLPDVLTMADYDPFGMALFDRTDNGDRAYRFGFNNMPKDNELYGDANAYDFGARIYDPRIARWLACDPLSAKYPFVSPYQFVNNRPIALIDPNGKEWVNPYTVAIKNEQALENPDADKIARLQALAQKVDNILAEFKTNDPELYDYIENLSHDHDGLSKISVVVYVSDLSAASNNPLTIASTMMRPGAYYPDGTNAPPKYRIMGTNVNEKDVAGLADVGPLETYPMMANVILYSSGKPQDENLANECGDVMFATEYSDKFNADWNKMNSGVDYYRLESTFYSFNVQAVYEARKAGTESKTTNNFPLIATGDRHSLTQGDKRVVDRDANPTISR